jgi:hypothetical protein
VKIKKVWVKCIKWVKRRGLSRFSAEGTSKQETSIKRIICEPVLFAVKIHGIAQGSIRLILFRKNSQAF